MSASATLRRNRTDIQSILSADPHLLIHKLYENHLITLREYSNRKLITTSDVLVIEALDLIQNKGETTCHRFLELLRTDEDLKAAFPGLQEKLRDYVELKTLEEMQRILQDLLDSLTQHQFEEFKWHLRDGRMFMRKSNLETASRRNTVKIIFQRCGIFGAMEETKRVLEKMGSSDLVQKLTEICSTVEAPTPGPSTSDPSTPGPSTSDPSTPGLSTSDPSTPGPITQGTDAQAGPSDWEEFTPEDSGESGTTLRSASMAFNLPKFGISSRRRKGSSKYIRPVSGQVLLFLTPPNTLEMHLLSINVNVDDVKAFVEKDEPRAVYLRVPVACELIPRHKYSVDCCYGDKQIHCKEKIFDLSFGPNYDMMFQIRLPPTTTEVSLTVKDEKNREVWSHNMNLPGPAAFQSPQQNLPPQKKLFSVGRRQLIRRRKIGGKSKRKMKMQLLSVLEDLGHSEFEEFKWFLNHKKLGDVPPIGKQKLQNATPTRVVDLMVQKYEESGAVEVTRRVLKNMNMNELRKKLTHIYSEPGGEGGPKTQTPVKSKRPLKALGTYRTQRAQLESRIRRMENLKSLSPSRPWSTNKYKVQRILQVFLDSLTEDQFDEFKRHLRDGRMFLRKSNLETVSRRNTVKTLLQRWGASRTMEETKRVLQKMGSTDLVQKLTEICSTVEGLSTSDPSTPGPSTSDPSTPGPSTSDPSTLIWMSSVGSSQYTPIQFSPSPSTSDEHLRVCENITEDCVDEDDEMNPDGSEDQQFVCTEAQAGPSDWEEFTPEDSAECGTTLYRFRCPHSGSFHCTQTGLVFVVDQKVTLQYCTVRWDELLLQSAGRTPAGPLFHIDCPENAVLQLYLPHCETKPVSENMLSIAHITDDGMSFIDPVEITDTHVVISVPHLSAFGLVWGCLREIYKYIRSVSGQVLLFLTPPRKLEVLLVSINVDVRKVKAFVKEDAPDAMYIKVPSKCKLIVNQRYKATVDCPEACEIQPVEEEFDLNFGPNYHTTFEITLPPNTKQITLAIKDQENEVWGRKVDLPAAAVIMENPPRTQKNISSKEKLISTSKMKIHLYHILEDLQESEFEDFKWLLKHEKTSIPSCQLEKAQRRDAVDLMVQTCVDPGAVEVTKGILTAINRNDLVQRVGNI